MSGIADSVGYNSIIDRLFQQLFLVARAFARRIASKGRESRTIDTIDRIIFSMEDGGEAEGEKGEEWGGWGGGHAVLEDGLSLEMKPLIKGTYCH